MKAFLREDLVKAGLTPFFINAYNLHMKDMDWFDPKRGYECLQHEAWTSLEHNMLMVCEDGYIFFGNSIDFDFKEE